jgi:hypothetical protein
MSRSKKNRHHHHSRREKTHVIGRLEDLRICCSLKKVSKENQPKQHGLNEGKQHAEFFTA